MRAQVFTGPHTFVLKELEVPSIQDDEVLVRVRAVGACGSDFHGFTGESGRRYPGMVMGHEIAGEIEQLGASVHAYKRGDHVVVQPIHSCGHCTVCREGKTSVCLNKRMIGVNMDQVGGLAEYIPVHMDNIYGIHSKVPFEIAALSEPLAVGFGAVGRSGMKENLTVAIVGAGMIGVSILLAVSRYKPSKIFIIDQKENKLHVAENLGAIAINFRQTDPVKAILEQTDGLGADITFEAVGLQTSVTSSILATRVGGRIVWVGNMAPQVNIPMQEIVTKAREILGVYCYEPEDFRQSVQYIETNPHLMERFVNTTVPLERTQDLFTQLSSGELDVFRAVITV
ncbi:MAG: alcohol dehydrogenase catalytic domain-containing protein [Sphaerochaetaceae bacterium]|nr:alcohol dehydrogenase catalytic domain-containing protein [Sphaerochaetaceae bacterium]